MARKHTYTYTIVWKVAITFSCFDMCFGFYHVVPWSMFSGLEKRKYIQDPLILLVSKCLTWVLSVDEVMVRRTHSYVLKSSLRFDDDCFIENGFTALVTFVYKLRFLLNWSVYQNRVIFVSLLFLTRPYLIDTNMIVIASLCKSYSSLCLRFILSVALSVKYFSYGII